MSTEFQPDGYVYILKAGPYYKIGRTTNPGNRIKSLQIQLPFEVAILNLSPCESHVESETTLHRCCGRYRRNGEWFELSDNLARYLSSIEQMSGDQVALDYESLVRR